MIIASHPHSRKEKAEEEIKSLKLDKHNLRLTEQKLEVETTSEERQQHRTNFTNLSHNLSSLITMDFSRRYNNNSKQQAQGEQEQIHNSVEEAQSESVDLRHHHHQNTFKNKYQVWSFGQMFLLFLFICSLSTSQVTGIPLGTHEDSKNNPHIVTADRDYRVVNHGTDSPPSSLHLKPKRSTEDDQMMVSGGGSVIEDLDVGESSSSGGGHDLFPMYHGQVYFPSLLKPNTNNEGGLDVTDEISSSSNSEESSRPNKDLEKGVHPHHHRQEPFDRNRYTSYPSSLRQLNKNEILQRKRRNVGPSLSIVNPLDVLRQRLLLEIARRKMRQTHNNQIIANAEILKNIG